MLEYLVMKNRDLKLSDVADLNSVSELLDVEILGGLENWISSLP